MEDLKQALRDFVATSNSGKYQDEATLLSKFPELSGYDPQVLRDFVATSNSGQYASEEELFSKFPEFGQPVKKKEETSVPLWLQKQEQPKPKQEQTPPFLESKPSGISLGSQRVPETAPMFEPPPMRTPEEAQAIVETKVPEQGWLLNTVSSLDKGFAKNLIGNPVKGIGTLLEGATGKVFGGSGKGPISDALIKFGDWYNNAIDELTPQDEEYKNSLSDQFSQAFGQVASLIMTGGVAGAGKEGAAIAATAAPKGIAGTVGAAGKQLASDLASPTAISAGLAMGQSEFDRAKQAGATDEQAYEAFYKNAAVGSVLEQIPVMQFLKRFNQSTAGGVANYIKTKGVAGLTGGLEEMTTEVLQQLYANKTAQEVYNINQGLLEGVGESGGVGFGVGFLLNAMGARAKVLKKEGNVQEAQMIENQIDQFESKPQGPPPTYSVNGIKMQSPEVINQMIDNMNAAELSTANIEITNDPELNNKLQEKIVVSSTKQQVRDVNPNLDEETLDKITLLETELKKLEGNKTQTAKDKAADIRSQIKTLQENAVQKPSTEEGVLRPEEPQVGLPEVGEGNAQEQVPTEEVVKEEVVAPEEEVQAAFDRLEVPDQEALKVDDELKTINESIGRVKEEGNTRDDERTLVDLEDKIIRAKKNVASAEDTDAAIEELKQAQKERDDFEQSIEKRKNFNTVDALISEEIYQKARDKDTYEYQELFDQDPRLAALQSAKDMAAFAKENNRGEERINKYENDIKILEEDIVKFPVKTAEVVSPATPVVEVKPKVSSKTPKAKAAPTPAPTPVVSQPVTKALTPEALQEEYKNKILEVTLNKDKSRTSKQIDERKKELIAEYNKLKAEMTAPKPKAKVEPKIEAKPKPAPAKVVSKKDQEEIKALEDEIEYQDRQIEDAIEEIGNTKYNLKEALAEIKKKRDELKGKKMSKEEREGAKEDLDAEIEDAKDEHDTYLEQYNDQLSEAKKAKKKAETKLAKLKAKQEQVSASVVEEEGPSYDEVKDIDPNDETGLKKLLNYLDRSDASLSEFSRGNLSMGMAVPLAKAIVKSLKVLVKAGITLQEAIKRVAAENNVETKDIVNMIKELDSAQSPMVKLKSQIQNEIQSVKDGIRSANEAVEAIVKYFNFNAERGNLTRRDLGRVINAIAKVKDQKSLDKAANKIFEIIDKAKTDVIEVSQSKALVSQIKLEARAALSAKKDINQKRKDLSNVIKTMETTGKISAAKARAILNKIGKVNLDNPAAVDSFLDYVENVFENAAYEVELAGINAKIAKAKNNVDKKIGTAKNLTPLLNKLFNIKPSLIPAEVFDAYKDIIDMFGDNAAVLDLADITEVTQQVQSILNQVDDQLSTIPALATKLFNYDKAVLTEDGALDYSATIEKMKADETIDEAEYDLMKKYKSYILPKASVIPKTKQELADEKKALVKEVKDAANQASISPLANSDEKKMAANIIKLAKTNAVEALDNRQLENLLKIFDNFSNGYFPAYANGINNDLIAADNASYLSKAIAKAKMPTLASFKLKIRNKRQALLAKVKSVPLFNIDEIFGDFKSKDIFNSIFNALATNQQRYALEIEKINQRLEDALNKIAKTYGNNENKIVESKMKMAIYRIQREFESNPGDARVNPAIEYINETVKAIREGDTNYSDEDADMLEKIAKDYSDSNGQIDAKKLENSFNSAEKDALKLFDEINNGLEGNATFTGDVIRGDKVYLLNNYNHVNVLPKKNENPDTIADAMSKFDAKNVVSTKAKSLIERTTGAKPINFDIFSTVQRGANFVLMDYYLTNPVRIARKTINTTAKMMEENGTLNENTKTILNVVNDAVELSLKSALDQAAVKDTFADKVVKEIAKTGYRAMLGGIPRATTELTSNMAYIAMVAPKEWAAGTKTMKNIDGSQAVNIMEAVGSKVITRVYGSDPLKGRLVDPAVLSKRVGIGASKLKGETLNAISTIHNNTTKKVKNSAEFVADTLVSTPDKIMMRPLWFGSFEKAFEDFSGSKPDYNKIEANDADYMIKNKESLEAAGRVADEKVTMAGNVDNPYMSALRTHISSDMSALVKTFKVFDNFMLKFQIGEFLTARRGIQAMMGNGNISKEQGAKLMAAVITRMTVYTVMSKMAAQFFYGLFLDDEEEDDDKSFAQKLGQGLASTFTSLILGRDFGNVARSAVNYGVEKANEKYLDFLRDGDYDPYEDAIQYTFIPPEKKGKSLEAFDVLANISGPYSPALKSLDFVTKKLTEQPKKEGSAIERQESEKAIRIPLEVLGNLGYVPMYKDIRAIVNKSIYSELDRELDKQGQKEEEFKPMGLNKTDLKRYYPEIYEQYYGEGSQEEAKRKLEYEKKLLERKMKDDYYNYVPKQRSKAGFGSQGFGEGTGKKSGGFGSKGFGK